MEFDENTNVEIESISTGSLSLDTVLGVGGLPRGRIIEIFGPESSGKTTLALHVIAEAQKAGGFAAFMDAEHDLDPVYATNLGIDIDNLIVSQPDNGEEAFGIVEELLISSIVDIIVIDSVAALVPKAEIDSEIGSSDFRLQSKLMSQAIARLSVMVKKSNAILIFTNQLRKKLNGTSRSIEITPGGKALKINSSIRLELRRMGILKKKNQTVGTRINVKIVKNKLADPFKEVELHIVYGKGIVNK